MSLYGYPIYSDFKTHVKNESWRGRGYWLEFNYVIRETAHIFSVFVNSSPVRCAPITFVVVLI